MSDDYDERERDDWPGNESCWCDWCGKRIGERIYYYEDNEPSLCCEDPSCVEKAEASGWEGMQFWTIG
jgi:hypothetical protein